MTHETATSDRGDSVAGRYVTPLGAREDAGRIFGPTGAAPLGLSLVHHYVATADVASRRRVAGYLRRLGGEQRSHWEPSRDGAPRPSVRHAVLETFPGVYVQAWVPLDQDVTTFGCLTCIGQMFAGHGGPRHDPEPTCRNLGVRPHCTCRGCW